MTSQYKSIAKLLLLKNSGSFRKELDAVYETCLELLVEASYSGERFINISPLDNKYILISSNYDYFEERMKKDELILCRVEHDGQPLLVIKY